jgi:IS605 OrfB family transposase
VTAIRTYQTRLKIDASCDLVFNAYGTLTHAVELDVYRSRRTGENAGEARKRLHEKHSITVREYDSIASAVDGSLKSASELRLQRVEELKYSIRSTEKTIKRLQNRKTSDTSSSNLTAQYHNKMRRLGILTSKLSAVTTEIDEDRLPRLCFGSRRLFKAQYDLAGNGYVDHAAWLVDWRNRRTNQFYIIGDKNKIGGNLEFCLIPANVGYIGRMRIPDTLGGGYLTFDVPQFDYTQRHRKGHPTASMPDEHLRRALALTAKNRVSGAGVADDVRTPISYRFVRDDKGWKLYATVHIPDVPQASDRRLGSLGVDLNANHLAWCVIDKSGNPIDKGVIPLHTYGTSSGRRSHLIGLAVQEVATIAKQYGVPVVIESLDFKRKKSDLREQSARYARMLSSFAYSQFNIVLSARCFDAGIEMFRVNPAYSSRIGYTKFAERYGLTGHQAAALVLARRIFSYREGIPDPAHICVGAGGHVTLPRPADRGRHVWSSWAVLLRQAKAVHVGRLRALKRPSSGGRLRKGENVASVVTAGVTAALGVSSCDARREVACTVVPPRSLS